MDAAARMPRRNREGRMPGALIFSRSSLHKILFYVMLKGPQEHLRRDPAAAAQPGHGGPGGEAARIPSCRLRTTRRRGGGPGRRQAARKRLSPAFSGRFLQNPSRARLRDGAGARAASPFGDSCSARTARSTFLALFPGEGCRALGFPQRRENVRLADPAGVIRPCRPEPVGHVELQGQ